MNLLPHRSHRKKDILQVQKEKEENQMTEKLEDRCKRLIVQHEYKECEKNWERQCFRIRIPKSLIT